MYRAVAELERFRFFSPVIYFKLSFTKSNVFVLLKKLVLAILTFYIFATLKI